MLVFDQLRKADPQLRLLALMLCVGLAILSAGLWWVQVVHAREFQSQLEYQSSRTVRVPSLRGKILDRNGKVLAENRPSYNVNLYLEDLPPQFRAEYQRLAPRQIVTNRVPFWRRWLGASNVTTQYVKLDAIQKSNLTWQVRFNVASNTINEVATRLQQPRALDFADFQKHYQQRLALPYPVLKNLNDVQLARFEEQFSMTPGIDLDVQSSRIYPFETTAAHLLGYVRHDDSSAEGEFADFYYRLPDYRGQVGIEGGYDAELRGRAGAKTVLINNHGYRQTESVQEYAEIGKQVTLTIDLALQQDTEAAMRRRLDHDAKAAVVVMDVSSGDILALASTPCSNPNYFIRGFPNEEEKARWTNAAFGVQKNRATREQYQAGSIFKTMVALAGLENGLDPNAKYHVEADPVARSGGAIFVGKQRFHDTAQPGDYDLRRAIARSSNAYFINCGLQPGVFDRVVELGRRLHLGERMGLKLLQEAAGHFPDADKVRYWPAGEKANICIGQGAMDVTPTQMAVMSAAIANGGKVLQPRVVSRIESANPNDLEPPTIFPDGQVRDDLGVSQRSLNLLRAAMLAETEDPEGTGKAVLGCGFRVCGKTGTAERRERGQVQNTTWFASFAPYEQPRYAVVVMVENGASGGTTCAPVAHDVYVGLKKFDDLRAQTAIARNE